MSNNPYRTLLTEIAAELDWSQQRLMDNRKATHPLADRARVLLDQHLEPESAADCLAARPLMARVAAMANCIGRHTVGEIMAISDQAASWLAANPPGQPVAAGEVAKMVGRLKELAHATTKENWREFDMRVPAEPLRDADLVLTRAADLLQRQHPQPVAVAERPWKREGWCDEQGECWLETVTLFPDRPAWIKTCPAFAEKFPQCFVYVRSLPANALPTPEAQP